MKLREIIESYEDLPGEDEFGPDVSICVACERPIEEWGTTCDCEADFCRDCLETGRFEFPEDYKFEKRGIGYGDELGLQLVAELGEPAPIEHEALAQCPECQYKARPFVESYEELPDADEFGSPLEMGNCCDGVDYEDPDFEPQEPLRPVDWCSVCGEVLCEDCGALYRVATGATTAHKSCAGRCQANMILIGSLDPTMPHFGAYTLGVSQWGMPDNLDESYEGLPDADEFGYDEICESCNEVAPGGDPETIRCENCHVVYCRMCRPGGDWWLSMAEGGPKERHMASCWKVRFHSDEEEYGILRCPACTNEPGIPLL